MCAVCQSEDPLDKRYRASVYVESARGGQILIDTSPEFRLQAVRAGIRRLDALFFTHDHADHTHGLDDVRPFTQKNPLPVYGNAATITGIQTRFRYIFEQTQTGGGKPRIIPAIVTRPVSVGGLSLTPVPVKHGGLDIYGWKIVENDVKGECGANRGASFAYITDASGIPDASGDLIQGVDCLVLGALRKSPHPTHFSFDEAAEVVRKAGVPEAYFTHICHEHSHKEIIAYCAQTGLPIKPAFDGMTIMLT
jgi:phosphoribosyl 1,2-cyclic phosphate phosphodiesterase